jgi:hypothetical protein
MTRITINTLPTCNFCTVICCNGSGLYAPDLMPSVYSAAGPSVADVSSGGSASAAAEPLLLLLVLLKLLLLLFSAAAAADAERAAGKQEQ